MLAYRILFTRNSDKAGLVHYYNIYMDMEGFKEKKARAFNDLKYSDLVWGFTLIYSTRRITDQTSLSSFTYGRPAEIVHTTSLINSIALMYLCILIALWLLLCYTFFVFAVCIKMFFILFSRFRWLSLFFGWDEVLLNA